MKKIFGLLICVLLAFCLVSCEKPASKTQKAEQKPIEITFAFNQEKSIGHKVCVDTTLPVGTLVEVSIRVGNYYPDKEAYESIETVKVQAGMDVNYFITEKQLDKYEKELEDKNYILSFNTLQEQPDSVRNIIGEKGELMTGMDVYSTDAGYKEARGTKLISKTGEQFKLAQ